VRMASIMTTSDIGFSCEFGIAKKLYHRKLPERSLPGR
jgi:hypothetical protein